MEEHASIINKVECIKPRKLLCIMVNRIYHWLSGKEKYGRHYCLAGTGFAGEPRVLSGSAYKSKTQERRRWWRLAPRETTQRAGVLVRRRFSLPLLLFCFKYISFLLLLYFFPSKRYNHVILFLLLTHLFVEKKLKSVSYFLLKLKFATF